MIEPLPRVMRDYLAGFNLGCILVSSTGEIQVVGSNHLARMRLSCRLWWTQDRATEVRIELNLRRQRSGELDAGRGKRLCDDYDA
jgi:hypothetical protein